MVNATDETRDRVRELVRQVLASVPSEPAETPAQPDPHTPEHIVVNSLKDKLAAEWDRDESSKLLLTEDDIRGLANGARLRVNEKVKFTPLAADIIQERGIELIKKASRTTSIKVRSVAIGSDHGGFKAKEALKAKLAERGVNVRDFGTDSEEAVDYPDFAHAVGKAVGAGHVEAGILIDGAGIGSAIAANKVPNARAAQCYSVALAKNSREHNSANILSLGAGQNSIDEMWQITETFLSTEISEDRHKKRVAKIDAIDRQYRK